MNLSVASYKATLGHGTLRDQNGMFEMLGHCILSHLTWMMDRVELTPDDYYDGFGQPEFVTYRNYTEKWRVN